MFYALSVKERLCPKCGAYWVCDCSFDEPARVDWSRTSAGPGCDHDWTEVLGVDLDEAVSHAGEARVLLCRLCGLYAVEQMA
jgi:hypothetical protein